MKAFQRHLTLCWGKVWQRSSVSRTERTIALFANPVTPVWTRVLTRSQVATVFLDFFPIKRDVYSACWDCSHCVALVLGLFSRPPKIQTICCFIPIWIDRLTFALAKHFLTLLCTETTLQAPANVFTQDRYFFCTATKRHVCYAGRKSDIYHTCSAPWKDAVTLFTAGPLRPFSVYEQPAWLRICRVCWSGVSGREAITFRHLRTRFNRC